MPDDAGTIGRRRRASPTGQRENLLGGSPHRTGKTLFSVGRPRRVARDRPCRRERMKPYGGAQRRHRRLLRLLDRVVSTAGEKRTRGAASFHRRDETKDESDERWKVEHVRLLPDAIAPRAGPPRMVAKTSRVRTSTLSNSGLNVSRQQILAANISLLADVRINKTGRAIVQPTPRRMLLAIC